MGDILRRRLRQNRFESPAHEALLGLLVVSAEVRGHFERVCLDHGISNGQYNVLRILRGHPDGYPRCEITARLVERAPDVTRLIDRLERQGLVERSRGEADRRHSITRITRKGIELLDRMHPAVASLHRSIEKRLSVRDARELGRLCETLLEDE
jgi:DNA-binding MarR family transcriptional regulator